MRDVVAQGGAQHVEPCGGKADFLGRGGFRQVLGEGRRDQEQDEQE